MINDQLSNCKTGLGLDTIIIQFVLMRYIFCLLNSYTKPKFIDYLISKHSLIQMVVQIFNIIQRLIIVILAQRLIYVRILLKIIVIMKFGTKIILNIYLKLSCQIAKQQLLIKNLNLIELPNKLKRLVKNIIM